MRLGVDLDAKQGGDHRQQRANALDRLHQLVVDLRWLLGRLHLRANRAERNGFKHRDPTLGQSIGGEVASCRRGQLVAQLDGETHASLGRLRRQLERTHDAADAKCGIDIAEPQVQLFLLLGDEGFLQLGGDLASRFVASHHRVFGGCDNAAQIA